jgi:DNA-binding NtrC family response regulator
VEIPALRERREDIELLIGHFLDRFAPGQARTVTPAALRVLREYGWPGNIRELRNITQRLALFAGPAIDADDLPAEIRNGIPAELLARACRRCLTEESMTFNEVVECLETNLLRQALQEAAGNRSQAARALGMSLSTLRDKLRKYGLDPAA